MDDTERILSTYFARHGVKFNDEHSMPAWLRRQLLMGYKVELEHGTALDARLDVSHNSVEVTVKIALAHLREAPDYYDRLKVLEEAADEYWKANKAEHERKNRDISMVLS